MASNVLSLPFRRSPVVSLADAIKQYISTKYDQHPDMFAKDLEAIDQLRTSAIHATDAHVSGIQKLQAYAAQLVWLSGKFPIDIGVEFPWYPALGYNTSRPVSQNNLRFELANVIFNLAAMYSQLANAGRSTSDALKVACGYYCQAAGVLSHLKTTIIPDMRSSPPEDMETMALESLEQLMLAQAQECVWQKAVKDGLKDATIAKLAAKVSDFYADAGDYGRKTDAISSEWIHHMTAKHHHFAAAAQYRAACDCLEKRKYGEEVARLRDSVTCVTEALKESRYINKSVLADLTALRNRVQEDLKRAEKDNDVIYLMPVPAKSELKTLDRASMVQSRIPTELTDPISFLGEKEAFGKPLFTQLVPYSVHVAATLYEDRKVRTSQTIIEELETMTTKIHELLSSLNLPGALQAIEKPLGLPPGLVSHAEEVRQQDGINRLGKTIEETEKVKANDRNLYQEGLDLLRSESAEDERSRRKHGTDRWARATSEEASPKLYAQIKEIQGYLAHSESSDDMIRKKFANNESLIKLLAGSNHDLEHYVPSSRRAALPPNLEQAVNKLRSCLNDVGRLETRRKRKIEALQAKVRSDDIKAARLEREFPMQKIESSQFESLFAKRLGLYDVDKIMVNEEEGEQDKLATRLRETNSGFVTARQGDTSTKKREQALQSLENAYFQYKELISNLEAARKFYNELAKIVSAFRDECRNFAYQRRAEASQLESDLSSAMAGLHLNTAATLQQQKQAESMKPSYGDKAPNQEPLTAPQPTRGPSGMWNPDAGIRFGSGGPPAAAGQQDTRWDPSKGVKFA